MDLNKALISTCLVLSAFTLKSQIGFDKYIVYFSDKDNTPYSLSQPEAYLSQRAIMRRQNQNIAVDEKDLPIDPQYIQIVLDLGDVELLAKMKWLNAILIETTDPAVLEAIEGLGNVTRLEIAPITSGSNPEVDPERGYALPKTDADYGPSFNQINQLNGLGLHDDGFQGQGIWIGVMDGGFTNVPTAAVFEFLNSDSRILATYNFVDRNTDVYQRSSHGTAVLSTMAGFQIDSLIGTAPQASYVLCITEDVLTEQHSEEAFWIAGAAYADSIGVDILNTSLGYTTVDDGLTQYGYPDMDGNTALITIGADIAASRGMLVVNSAGNSGNSDWFYIGAPADGDSVLAIGSVNAMGDANGFSSRGPSFDGRVKPNVMAQGGQTVVTDGGGGIATSNGTSFSSPVLAGMAASLWQAYPTATAWQVHQAIEASASLFTNPNDSMGYGIPDFEVARAILNGVVSNVNEREKRQSFGIFPNPYSEGVLSIVAPDDGRTYEVITVWDVSGRMIAHQQLNSTISVNVAFQWSPIPLTPGYYILELSATDQFQRTAPFVVR